ncbi:MAG TPA: phosphoenolpyruvate--protein phosphotransferase, partial [Alphaproteobacteria bacterium]|nr:phosphoenolpyruvate--protein phosphotransferase [Alphaproteobacteria bacterium]
VKDAPLDPRFVVRPEMGEESFHGYCGVPLLRDGKTRGVLVIQSRRVQEFSSELINILTTIAMLVTELVASHALVSRDETISSGGPNLEPFRIPGISFNHGIAIGRAVRLVRKASITRLVADNPEAELRRFNDALNRLQNNFDDLLSDADEKSTSYEILETYKLFTIDRGWLKKISSRIQQGLTAEAAVQAVQDDTTTRLARATDLYLRERAQDFVDVSQRLLHLLLGEEPSSLPALTQDAILIASDLSAADLITYDMSAVRGIALEGGSPSSHITIMARAMGVPVIGQCKNLLSHIEDGDQIIVDADRAQLYVEPPQELIDQAVQRHQMRENEIAQASADAKGEAISLDGERIALYINAGLLSHLPNINALDADGIGLYRTEVPFMALGHYPSINEQAQIYARVMMECGHKPILFRTLDIGSDKKLPYMPHIPEDNPALGWRGLRVGLDRPALLRQQFRALLIAANGRKLSIMLPMVAAVGEVKSARHTLNLECEYLMKQGVPMPAELKLGIMFEVPSLMWQLPELMDEVDFISIGSNDLFQYTYAVDRGSSHLQGVFDPLCDGFLRMLRDIVRAADAAHVPLSLCGEMAAKPLEAMVLLGLGVRSLSIASPAVAGIKAMVRSTNIAGIAGFLSHILDIAPPEDYRAALRAYAKDHRIALGELPQMPPPLVG